MSAYAAPTFRMALFAVLMAMAMQGWGATEPPAPAQGQTREAVAAYEAGRFDVAIQGFAEAARKGNRLAQFNYAMMLLRGEGTAAKPQEALIWLRKAADNRMTHAQFTFGDLYERGELVPRSLEEANRWYERAAQGGHVQAQMALATNYFTGRGVPLDYGRAFGWYSKAAASGDGPAQYIVGSYYERGYPGVVDKDIEQAKIWYARAASHGDPGALAKLRSLLEDNVRAKGQM
ncbi:sel1 repeat family protein [Cupriavidus pauculus]|nr:sel1 repeat family protein [Cupriavidus pauculus]UAK98247.1 sel1 repeat family protein [Cupriavidus pauculus]